MFAVEYNSSRYRISEEDERSPVYVLTPLGALVNRLYAVGVVTDITNIGTPEEPMIKARIIDPTGVYYISSGQYQIEATQVLKNAQEGNFLAVIGKARTYTPEDGVMYVSIRPEMIKIVDESTRDVWVVEAAESMVQRVKAMEAAMELDPPTPEKLMDMGFSKRISEGAVRAFEMYGRVDTQGFIRRLKESLSVFLPGEKQAFEVDSIEEAEVIPITDDEVEEIMSIIEEMLEDGPAAREVVLAKATFGGMDAMRAEEALNYLVDSGKLVVTQDGLITKGA